MLRVVFPRCASFFLGLRISFRLGFRTSLIPMLSTAFGVEPVMPYLGHRAENVGLRADQEICRIRCRASPDLRMGRLQKREIRDAEIRGQPLLSCGWGGPSTKVETLEIPGQSLLTCGWGGPNAKVETLEIPGQSLSLAARSDPNRAEQVCFRIRRTRSRLTARTGFPGLVRPHERPPNPRDLASRPRLVRCARNFGAMRSGRAEHRLADFRNARRSACNGRCPQ
jgi:hypothetical protein